MSAVFNERPTAKGTTADFPEQRVSGAGSKSAKASRKAAQAATVAASVAQAGQGTSAEGAAGAGGEAAVGAGMELQDLLVPLDKLVLSEANVRTVVPPASISELAALIFSQGLLQRLLVVPQGEGVFAVVAGGRRLRAMQLLVSDGKWPLSQPVECKVFADERAVEVSLAENSGRADMHPADQMEAFRQLIEQGKTVAQVAGRFGVSVLTVERRLKLARLAPRFLELYRADDIRPDQLMALTLTEDHAAQEAVWDGAPAWGRSAHDIRRALTEQSCAADSRLARFVGVADYEARGGAVRRDLFSQETDEEAGVYLDDPVLLQTLAMEKLRGLAEGVRAEGWGWVYCLTEGDTLALRQFGREAQTEREPNEEELATLEALRAERTALEAAWDRHAESESPDEEDLEATEARLSVAEAELDAKEEAAQDALTVWTPEQMARSGALLRIDYRGNLIVDRGLVRQEDAKARRAEGEGGSVSEDGTGDGATGTAGGDDAAGDGKKKRSDFSEKLMRDLTAHRTAALQAALMQNPQVALVVLVHRLAQSVFSHPDYRRDVVRITLQQTSDTGLAQDATDYENSPAGTLLGRAATEWGERVPGSSDTMFAWLLKQDQGTLLDLLAYCTACSLDAVASKQRSHDHSDDIAQALGLDMADWWVPTCANYLSQVSKAKAQEAVKEATGSDPAKELDGKKKADAVAWCAGKLEGTRWLPLPLRILVVRAGRLGVDYAHAPADDDQDGDHEDSTD